MNRAIVLNGGFISLKEHKLTMVATDGRRLALVDEEAGRFWKRARANSLFRRRRWGELSRLLTDKGGEVEIRYTDNQASFTLKDDKGFSILIISKLIEGNYPNYRQVIVRRRQQNGWRCRARNFCMHCGARRS